MEQPGKIKAIIECKDEYYKEKRLLSVLWLIYGKILRVTFTNQEWKHNKQQDTIQVIIEYKDEH